MYEQLDIVDGTANSQYQEIGVYWLFVLYILKTYNPFAVLLFQILLDLNAFKVYSVKRFESELLVE